MDVDLILDARARPAELAELGVLAEQKGFSGIWVSSLLDGRDPFANLVLLARPDARPARTRRPPPAPERIDHMARISRGRFEQSYYATIF